MTIKNVQNLYCSSEQEGEALTWMAAVVSQHRAAGPARGGETEC